MPAFGKRSLDRLSNVDAALVEIVTDIVAHYDITVISGKRDKIEQDELFARGLSKTKYPKSKHNYGRGGITGSKCIAVDIAPFPVDWNDTNAFCYLAGMVKHAAHELGYAVRWGGDWDQDDEIIKDQTFQDLGHFELVI
jgi:peptidoglycan L-alanyl-D-glutamate endopeptidase CwlK